MSDYVPLFVDISGLRTIVFGGGNVALRKCRYLKGADITVIARDVLPELEGIVSKTVRRDIPEDVSDMIGPYDFVMVATDNKELNSRIRDQVLSAGKYVNSAHGGGNVLIPSVLEREHYTVAVSSNGNVPAFPPYVVSALDTFLDSRYDRMIDLMIEMRAYAMRNIPEQKDRKDFLQSVINDMDIQSAVANDDVETAKKLALNKVNKT